MGRKVLGAALLALAGLARAAAVETPTPTPPTLGPVTLAVAIDETAMSDRDIGRARDLILSLLPALPERSQIAIAVFSGEKRIVLPPTTDKVGLAATTGALKAGRTGVALADGLFDIVQFMSTVEAPSKAILLISGGHTADGDLNFDDPLDVAAKKQIPIFTMGMGQSDGRMLRRMAKLTGGEYIRMEVADAPMLAHSLTAAQEASAAAASSTVAESSARPSPSPGGPSSGISGGVLGFAAIFFAFGGILMLGIVILLVRRLNAPAAAPQTPTVSAAKPAPPAIATPSRSGRNLPNLKLDDPDEVALEKTLVVEAKPTLRALSGPGAGKNFAILPVGRTMIGRSRSSDIVVPEDAASAQHCRIDREGDSYVLYDLGSTNGTWLNGAKISRALLQHGDRLKVGGTTFTVGLFGDRD